MFVRSTIFAAWYCILSKASLLVDDKDIHTAHPCVNEGLITEIQSASPK
jgi:hypothetical protein